MSMIGNLRRLSDADLAKLLASPRRISSYLYESDDRDEEDGEAELGPHADIDIDKAWHGLHFLLTGDATGGSFPLGFLLVGGTDVGEEDVGYGPARGFRSADVKEIAAALEKIDRASLVARFDGEAMTRAEIYPSIWSRRDEEAQNLEYLLDAFDTVQGFVMGAAEAGEALLVYLN